MTNSIDEKLRSLLRACRKKDRGSQKELYRQYYSYAMNICLHYSQNREEAQEILNDGFFKVFENLDKYDPSLSFKGWLRRLLINTAIDYYRRYHRNRPIMEIMQDAEPSANFATGFDQLALDDLLAMIQRLSPSYRLVFNLYVLEGFKHEEIAEQMGISVGASKSNLSRAKEKLQGMIAAAEKKVQHV
ncbi:MAG: sigma-70 family RNA polymerase sigma factor [Bacteroidetes bacterium]|nr:sigma-70 family RNA polymerase sigma factor [Bacteroidota bacterium]